MIYRIAAIAFGITCLATIIALVITSESKGADFHGDWRFEQLTCEELVSGYKFSLQVLEQIVQSYTECLSYYRDFDSPHHGDLHCAVIKKEGMFVQGMTNDFANTFNSKCAVNIP